MRRLPLFALVALFVGGGAADARHRPTDRIAFARSNNIYVMNADGSVRLRSPPPGRMLRRRGLPTGHSLSSSEPGMST
jgi:hypothetical protein